MSNVTWGCGHTTHLEPGMNIDEENCPACREKEQPKKDEEENE